MTTMLQQAPRPAPVQPLRKLIDSKYGKATIQAYQTVWTAASGSPALVSGLQSILAAGIMAKHQLPTSYESKLDETFASAIEKIENFPVEKTIEQIDTSIDENITMAKTKLHDVAEQTNARIVTTKTSIDDAKTQVTETIDSATTKVTATVGNAQTKVTETIGNAKTQLTETVGKQLNDLDQNKTVNNVVDAWVEPAVRTVVDYVLPEEEEFEDAVSGEEETDEKDEAPVKVHKKALRLTKNVQNRVSKTIQKRWLTTSSQLENISARTEEVRHLIMNNGVDLIAYSKNLKGNLYGNVCNISKTVTENEFVAMSKEGISSGVSNVGTCAQLQLQRLQELSCLQLERIAPSISPFVSPMEPYVVAFTSRVGIVLGVDLDAQTLRKNDFFRKLFAHASLPPPKTKAGDGVKLADAKVESAKESMIRKVTVPADHEEEETKEEIKEDLHKEVLCTPPKEDQTEEFVITSPLETKEDVGDLDLERTLSACPEEVVSQASLAKKNNNKKRTNKKHNKKGRGLTSRN